MILRDYPTQNITIINLQVPLIIYRFNTYVLFTLNITAFIDSTNMAMPCYNLAESNIYQNQ